MERSEDNEKNFEGDRLYPRLEKPSAPVENNYINIEQEKEHDNTHRMNHIREIHNHLERNSEIRKSLSKKYGKVIKVLHYTNYGLNSISAAAGIASVSTLPTLALIPLSIVLGGISIGTSFFSIILTNLNKKLKGKETKHRDIYNLSENKLNLINSLLSEFLQDNRITDEEFQLILGEEKHFRQCKEDIRRRNRKMFFDEDNAKEQGKKELRDGLLDPINNLVKAIKKK